MQRINLELQPRSVNENKHHANPNQLRRDGLIPAVLYGHGEPVAVQLDAKTFKKAIATKAGTHALFNVKFGSKTDLSIVKEVQRDIFTREPVHVDFQRIDIKEKLEISTPVHATGESTGVKNEHGILEFIQREVRIKCLPDDIPASIEVDITNLGLHHSIKAKDLTLPKGVELVTPGEQMLITVVTAKVEEVAPVAAAADAAAAAAEPEVIAKGKKEEEGAAAAAPAAEAADKGDKKKAK